jgi:hypothetical protein
MCQWEMVELLVHDIEEEVGGEEKKKEQVEKKHTIARFKSGNTQQPKNQMNRTVVVYKYLLCGQCNIFTHAHNLPESLCLQSDCYQTSRTCPPVPWAVL